jgi:hypothetical protein
MALVKGTITVDEDGVATGTGLALRIYNGIMGGVGADEKAAVGASMKDFCEGLAEAIVDEIRANAEVTVTITTSDAGLQRLPASLVENEPTKAPAASKTLTGTIE